MDVSYRPKQDEYREVFGVGFSQRRNDTIITPAHLLKMVVKGRNDVSENAVRDMVLACVCIKYTQSNSVGYALNGQMVGVGAGQQSRVDCVKLAARKVHTWYLRQHEKVLGLPFKACVGRQNRINARVRYIEGDFTAIEKVQWLAMLDEEPPMLTHEDKEAYMQSLSGVSLSSDAFFPFRDSIDHASKVGVSNVVQPGSSNADEEVMAACKEYGLAMYFTGVRLFHH